MAIIDKIQLPDGESYDIHAHQLTSATKIELTGGVTGDATFTPGAVPTVTINATVADDSHNHSGIKAAQDAANAAQQIANAAGQTASGAVDLANKAQATANTAVTNAATAQTAAEKAQQTANTGLILQHLQSIVLVDGDLQLLRLLFQRPGHKLRGQRTGRSGTGIGIMVGLIANKFAIAIGRKRDPQLTQIHKASTGKGRFTQGIVTIYTATGKQIFCHLPDAVHAVATKTQLIIGLLVATGIAGSSIHNTFCDNGHFLATLMQANGCAIPRCAGTNH